MQTPGRKSTKGGGKYYTCGTSRLLWETESEHSLYLMYARLPESTGLPEREIALMETDGWSPSELEAISLKNDWGGRAKAYDKFWKPIARAKPEDRIEDAEKHGSETSTIAFNLLKSRLVGQPHLIKTSELIAIAKLAPVLNRSESRVIKDD